MEHLNIEIKAQCPDLEQARLTLRTLGAIGPTLDQQVDTYFRAVNGRLKLREGDVERALIHYDRPDQTEPGPSNVTLFPTPEDAAALKSVLKRALGVTIVVEKLREIWWLDNAKIHLDAVPELGTFIEIEVIARPGLDGAALQAQCVKLMNELRITGDLLLAGSYSEMIGIKETAGG